MIDAGHSLDEQQKNKLREKLRAAIIEQCGAYEQPYEAYELVRAGRAVEIVGNPHYLDRDGKECELPYTGLEGYYAGSEKRSDRPGMTAEQIIEEEANTGLKLLKAIKQHCIEDYSWSDFSKMKRALGEEKADLADLRNLCLLWTEVVRRVRQRVYESQIPLPKGEGLASGLHLNSVHQRACTASASSTDASRPPSRGSGTGPSDKRPVPGECMPTKERHVTRRERFYKKPCAS